MTESDREEALRLGKDLSFIVAAWLANPGVRPDLEPSAKLALKAWLEFEPRLARHSAPQQEPFNMITAMQEAQKIVESKYVWKRFIDGTPLSNDIAVWMAEFARSSPAQPDVVRDALLREASRHLRQLRLVNLADRIDAIMSTRGEKP